MEIFVSKTKSPGIVVSDMFIVFVEMAVLGDVLRNLVEAEGVRIDGAVFAVGSVVMAMVRSIPITGSSPDADEPC